ncbi:MAG: hypothetical protein KDD44_05835 [Bdellovibrionales bacterium]|nr:hypothetical protein [Bdellovibrionales bacterium]
MRLNHVSNRISLGTLDLMIELMTSELNFRVLRRTATDVWLRQNDANVDIQFCETDAPAASGDKHNSHISFLSETPEAGLKHLADWFSQRGIRTVLGSWSNREFWLDAPEVFVDFTLESMTPDLAEYQTE